MSVIKKCIEKAKANIDKILLIPEIVNKVEDILWQFQGKTESPFICIDGNLIFWIDTYERKKWRDITIEVVVDMSRHHPTTLSFRQLFPGRTLFEKELLKFDDNLHMESKDDIAEIKNLIRDRLEKL